MPYSPKDTLVPPVALPCRSGRCCLRCATLRGMSISLALPARAGRGLDRGGGPRGGLVGAGALAAAAAAGRRPVPVPALAAGPERGLEGLALGPGGRRVTLVDPDLDADPAERRARLVEAVVDVGTQRVQRHPALAVELRPGHFRAAEPARALHPDA